MEPEKAEMKTEETEVSQEEKKGGGWWKPVLLLVIVLTLIICAKVFGLGDKLGELKEWISGLGKAGYIVFILIYIGATIAAIPGSALTLIAGGVYGTVIGSVLVSIGSTVGAAFCFLIARYFARGSIQNYLGNNEKFKKLDKLTEENGPITVGVTRLVPLFPFNLLNYGFGLTKVKFLTYFIISWICMLPMTIAYVAFADAISKGAEGSMPWGALITISAVILVMIIVVPFAKKKLNKSKENKTGENEDV